MKLNYKFQSFIDIMPKQAFWLKHKDQYKVTPYGLISATIYCLAARQEPYTILTK